MSRNCRTFFTTEEDNLIKNLVAQYGTSRWDRIANQIPNRSPRQIRERYINFLDPKIKNETWTDQESILLRHLVIQHGYHWTFIQKFFPARSTVNIKNQWKKIERTLSHLPTLTRFLNFLVPKKDIQQPQVTDQHENAYTVEPQETDYNQTDLFEMDYEQPITFDDVFNFDGGEDIFVQDSC